MATPGRDPCNHGCDPRTVPVCAKLPPMNSLPKLISLKRNQQIMVYCIYMYISQLFILLSSPGT